MRAKSQVVDRCRNSNMWQMGDEYGDLWMKLAQESFAQSKITNLSAIYKETNLSTAHRRHFGTQPSDRKLQEAYIERLTKASH